MATLVVKGGRMVSGTHRVSGNKNAALPMIAASLLTSEPVRLVNIPDIRAGIALVIAALCAKDETTILNAESIDRGYVSVEESLGALGATIARKA